MMNFCYLYVTNNDVFAKCFFVLICNVYFAIFIISTLKKHHFFHHLQCVVCNIHKNAKFLHTACVMCNFIFAHLEMCVQFCYDDCNFCTRH